MAGDGERLFFYVVVSCMLKYSTLQRRSGSEVTDPGTSNDGEDMVDRALECLFHIAPHAGGSRDVCSLIEHGIYVLLSELLANRKDPFSTEAFLSSSELIGRALGIAVTCLKDEKSCFKLVDELICLASQTLDFDLEIIGKEDNTQDGSEAMITSTLNVFLPHHDRGRQSGRKRLRDERTSSDSPDGTSAKQKLGNRNLVQSVSEMLIWSKTQAASSNGAFSSAYDSLVLHSKLPGNIRSMCPEERQKHKSTIQSCVHRMQTIVRHQRKVLNSYSRNRGYMLSDQYCLDPQAITLPMIKRGKAGDLNRLMSLASKSGETRVLEMIHLRNLSDPSRVVPMESLGDLKSNWVPLNGEEDDDLKEAKMKLQEAKVLSTLKYLRKRRNGPRSPPIVVASLDNSDLNQVASILLGAAMSDWIGDQEIATTVASKEVASSAGDERGQRVYVWDNLLDVSCFNACMERIDEQFALSSQRQNEDDGNVSMGVSGVPAAVAATKDVLNLIDRHVHDGDTLVLFASLDLQLPDHILADLQKRGCSIHCHKADDLSSRLKREGAQTGDVACSLMWDTGDDLDLHVIMPSGEEISFENKTSKCGLGCLDVDMNAGGAESKEPVENVFLGKPDELVEAPKGKYRVFVRNYAYHSSKKGTPVKWRVAVRINGNVLEYNGACVGTGNGSDVTACEFNYTGRTIPFEKQLENTSAFGTANLVNVTASTGQTLESLCQLMRAGEEHKELDRVRELVQIEDEADGEQQGEVSEVEDKQESKQDASESGLEKPLIAAHGQLDVTSRDRLYMLLCRLPRRFHDEVGKSFGGTTLMERCAAEVARRMLLDNVRMVDLKRSGYPPEVVEMVATIMKRGSVFPAN